MAVSKTEGLHDAVEMTKSEECADSRNKDSQRVLSQEEMDRLGAEVLVSDFKQIKLEKEAQKNWDLFYKRNSTNFFKDRHWTSREFEELQARREVSRWGVNPGRWTEVALLHNHTITVFLFQDSFRKVSTFQTWRTKDFPSGALDTPVQHQLSSWWRLLAEACCASLARLVCSWSPRGWCCWRLAVGLETASSLCWRTTSNSSFTPATSHRELWNLSRFVVFIKVNRKLCQLY